mmetsp:Transcript_9124/g.33670  ORF Transcript_9124/g.33670 Transcript_9124/m.33670 type:complete len:238 (-) Transcript_9124:3167-3880(-)
MAMMDGFLGVSGNWCVAAELCMVPFQASEWMQGDNKGSSSVHRHSFGGGGGGGQCGRLQKRLPGTSPPHHENAQSQQPPHFCSEALLLFTNLQVFLLCQDHISLTKVAHHFVNLSQQLRMVLVWILANLNARLHPLDVLLKHCGVLSFEPRNESLISFLNVKTHCFLEFVKVYWAQPWWSIVALLQRVASCHKTFVTDAVTHSKLVNNLMRTHSSSSPSLQSSNSSVSCKRKNAISS